MPGRTFSSELYRYGYQGSERDPEMLGGAGYTTFFRALDPRIGRWLTPDPKVFPWQSPYVSMDGNPVALVDVWGASPEGGEKGGAQKHADKYKAETGRSYSTDPSDGYVFDGVDVSAPAAIANTPANSVFNSFNTTMGNLLSNIGDFFGGVFSGIASGLYASEDWLQGSYSYTKKGGVHFYFETGGGNNENSMASPGANVQYVDAYDLLMAIGNAGAGKFRFKQGPFAIAHSSYQMNGFVQEAQPPASPVKTPSDKNIEKKIRVSQEQLMGNNSSRKSEKSEKQLILEENGLIVIHKHNRKVHGENWYTIYPTEGTVEPISESQLIERYGKSILKAIEEEEL